MSLRACLGVLLFLIPAFAASSGPAAADGPRVDPAIADALRTHGVVHVLVLGPAPSVPTAAARAEVAAALEESNAAFARRVEAAVAAAGARVAARWGAAGAVEVVGGESAVRALLRTPGVQSISLDGPISIMGEVAATGGDAARDAVNASALWTLGHRGAGVRLAVLDTGIDPTHEAFRHEDGTSRVVAWADFVAGAPAPYDDHGHGTYVAGLAAGSSAYSDPVWGASQASGVAPEARLMVAKILNGAGRGTFAAGLSGLQWAFEQGADVTLNSWGGACGSTAEAVLRAVRTYAEAGMVSVVAAGNGGPFTSSVLAPACSDSAVSVGALDGAGEPLPSSARGPCADASDTLLDRLCPDVAAPGTGLAGPVPRSGAALRAPSGYATLEGTSVAAALVGGGAALMLEANAALTGASWSLPPLSVRAGLTSTAGDVGAPGADNDAGAGRVDLGAWLDALALPGEPADGSLVATWRTGALQASEGGFLDALLALHVHGTPASGTAWRVEMEGPGAEVAVLAEGERSLGNWDVAQARVRVLVADDLPPGAYLLRARVASAGDERSFSTTFQVDRALVASWAEGPADATGAVRTDVLLVAENLGTTTAWDATLRLRLVEGAAVSEVPEKPSCVEGVHVGALGESPPVKELGDLAPGQRAACWIRVVSAAPAIEWSIAYADASGARFEHPHAG